MRRNCVSKYLFNIIVFLVRDCNCDGGVIGYYIDYIRNMIYNL